MSVVGPRPHLWSQNKTYGNKVKEIHGASLCKTWNHRISTG